MTINGGTAVGIGAGGHIMCQGSGLGGNILFRTPNTAMNADVSACLIVGDTDTPYLDMDNNRIANVAAPTLAKDALPYVAWADCSGTLTLTWATATPAAVTTIARWVQIGKTVILEAYIISADSNATTGLTITTLPVNPVNVNARFSCSAYERYGAAGATYRALVCQINANGVNDLEFLDFSTATDGQAVGVGVTAIYPVA